MNETSTSQAIMDANSVKSLVAIVSFFIIPIIIAILLIVFDKKRNVKGNIKNTININRKASIKVLENSKKISDLLELNEKYKFHQIREKFSIIKRYDAKHNYNNIAPAFLMTAKIRDDVQFFEDYSKKIRENRENLIEYRRDVEKIRRQEYDLNYEEIKISREKFMKLEEKLFDQRVIRPVIDCSFDVTMYYSSPAGRVNLSKGDRFGFDDMFASLESVSRSHLDKTTYDHLSAVERGEVSDSLRYDIMNRDNFSCVICGASANVGARLHVDHIVPISKGGKSIPSNLRTLCERCNVGKSNKMETGLDNQLNASDVNRFDSARSTNSTSQKSIICDQCGANMVVRNGQYGKFYGCTNYPNCRNIKKIQH